MNFANIIKPSTVVEETVISGNHAKIVIAPFMRGHALTMGNSFRRILLSSIEGSAVIGIKIDGFLNEYSTIPGVLEDVSEIVLNLKELVVKSDARDLVRLVLKKSGQGVVTGADVSSVGETHVVNTEHKILTLTSDDSHINMELIIGHGIGYVFSDDNSEKLGSEQGIIPIDSIFVPIKKVAYEVDSVRVGQSTDYEKLILTIDTNGSIGPELALSYAVQIFNSYLSNFLVDEIIEEMQSVEDKPDKAKVGGVLDMSIEELELSIRANNCLRQASIKTIRELVVRTDVDMLKTKNFGKKSLEEIKRVLSELGLHLGMLPEELEG